MVDKKFVEAYWLFQTDKLNSFREMGKYMGHSEYYHKGIYAKYKEDKKKYKNIKLRGTISDKKCFEKKSRGRTRKKGISEEFKQAYWDYENYRISVIEAYTRINYSKNWFYNIAKSYEKTDEYNNDIKNQKNISLKPCRVLVLPEGYKKDSETMSTKELSKKYNLNEIQCKRLLLKFDKKNIWKCIKENKK